MKRTKYFFLFSSLMTVSIAVSAEKVYESVDSKGGVEFSDQPSNHSQQIDVEPNVVHVVPVDDTALPTTNNASHSQLNTNHSENTVEHEVGNLHRREEENRLRREREHNNTNAKLRSEEMKNSAGTRAVEGGGRHMEGGAHHGGRH